MSTKTKLCTYLFLTFLYLLTFVVLTDANEIEIVEVGGLKPILEGAATGSQDLQAQCARALRNLSVNGMYVQTMDAYIMDGWMDRYMDGPMCLFIYVRVYLWLTFGRRSRCLCTNFFVT